jgi:hypothetical protein
VRVINIKGAFLKAKVPENLELMIKMEGELAQMMNDIHPNFTIHSDGCMYLRCVNALYGHVEAARLFYDDLNQSLTEKMGFGRNCYDPCVYNKDTQDGVVTVRTHVDDLTVSSISEKQILKFIDELKEIYGEITVNDETSHDYLGMIMIHHVERQTIEISMEKYINCCINEFIDEEPDERIQLVKTPATNYLFKTRDMDKISQRKGKLFHSTVAKLLFIAKRARPDILLAVSFLTTRVKEPDKDDWNKLIRILGYLKNTEELHITLHCKEIKDLVWYIDGSYATHDDMKGQNGAVLMIGDCAVLCRSSKQKVNSRSSTESELLAVDDALPTIQWTKSFMHDQGYDLKTYLIEDNRSTMLLMKNGKMSSGKRTKHFDIRYFYVKDLIDRGVINVSHCMSEDMIADFFTKPLQGKRFDKFRDVILNVKSNRHNNRAQERVG